MTDISITKNATSRRITKKIEELRKAMNFAMENCDIYESLSILTSINGAFIGGISRHIDPHYKLDLEHVVRKSYMYMLDDCFKVENA